MSFAFTFDDGPGPSTPDLLAVLCAHECAAGFFLIGGNILREGARNIAIQLIREGHLAGNHTMSHDARLDARDLRKEVDECDQLIAGLYQGAGVPVPQPIPFRLPFGIRTFVAERIEGGRKVPAAALDQRLQVLASMGRTHVHWTAILRDWEMTSSADVRPLVDMALSHIDQMEAAGLDTVFALHDGSQPDEHGQVANRDLTVQAVEQILSRAKEKGLTTFRAPIA